MPAVTRNTPKSVPESEKENKIVGRPNVSTRPLQLNGLSAVTPGTIRQLRSRREFWISAVSEVKFAPSEPDRRHVLATIRTLLKPGQMLFVGVIDPINAKIESLEQVRDRVLEAAEFIPVKSLGSPTTYRLRAKPLSPR